MSQEMTEFSMAVVRLSLGDVTRNRDRCAADLIGKAIYLPFRKGIGQLVDFCDQIHCLLPNHEIFEMLRHPTFLDTEY